MEKELKIALGKILGETYRLQKRVDPKMCGESDSTIYGLLSGLENVIDAHLDVEERFIPASKVNQLIEILTPYWEDEKKLESFKGYYDIERELTQNGINRGEAIRILTYLQADSRFTDVIEKMNSSGSPMECKNFELEQWVK